MKTKQMQVKIKKNAYIWAGTLRDTVKKLEGRWLDVETDFLFNDQYNIKEPNIRVFDSMVEAVRNDARSGMGKCKYCGTMLKSGQSCQKHPECKEYGADWFTLLNTYFLKYPQGVKSYPDEFLSIDPFNIKIGSYYLESYPSLDYFRLYNSRQTINFKFDGKVFYIHNGIGYKQAEKLPVLDEVNRKVRRKLWALNEKLVKDGKVPFFKE